MSDHAAVPARHWEGATPAEWRARWGVPDLRIFRSVGSTNDVARALADQGAPAGTVVLAEEQREGRGRRGRAWTARPGQSLLLSMILRPREPDAASVLPLRLGLAVARAIEDVAGPGLEVGIKWPNDLVAAGRKLGGLLCEGAIEGGRPLFVIAGIGVNVLQTDDDWPAELRGHATSITAETGRAIPIAGLAERVVGMVSIAAGDAGGGGEPLRADELHALARRDVLRGHAVTVDGRPEGKAIGVDARGGLVVERDGGTGRIITGTVRVTAGGERQGADET